MPDDHPTDYIHKKLERARAAGLAQPVLLVLPWRSPRARAVFEALRGRPMGPPPPGAGPGAARACLAGGAAVRRLLVEWAGEGGACVARLLADHPAIDIWAVALLTGGVRCSAFVGGTRVFVGAARYEWSTAAPSRWGIG